MTDDADTVYVVGGLYGNAEALRTVLQMREAEARAGRRVTLVFNGDYNWFDVDAASFELINDVATDSVSIQGNVEAELVAPSPAGCGCNYPGYVNADYVARSNAIMERLQGVAAEFPRLRARLGGLPLFRVVEVGGERIGIVHGDAESLSGWAFAAERLSPVGVCCSGDAAIGALTPVERIEAFFRAANVRAFACTHTCLPHARDYRVDGRDRLIINNGSAGMANFANTTYGLITRISADPTVPRRSLYGVQIGNARFDALPVEYDQTAWIGTFLSNWQPSSPAYESYFNRIVSGPAFDLRAAVGGGIRLSTL